MVRATPTKAGFRRREASAVQRNATALAAQYNSNILSYTKGECLLEQFTEVADNYKGATRELELIPPCILNLNKYISNGVIYILQDARYPCSSVASYSVNNDTIKIPINFFPLPDDSSHVYCSYVDWTLSENEANTSRTYRVDKYDTAEGRLNMILSYPYTADSLAQCEITILKL